MYRTLTALIVGSLAAAGCSLAANPTPVITPAAPTPMTALPPVTQPPAPTTTTTAPLDTEPPSVEMTISNGEIVDWYRGTITISTEADAQLTIDEEDIRLDGDGSVTIPVVNAPGENTIVVTATDEEGNSTEESIVYTFEPPEGWITAIGDSIMLGAAGEIELRLGDDIVDATVSRQFLDAPGLVADLVRRETPPQALIIGLGTNGPVQARHFDQVMETVGPETLVAFVNVRVPRDWEATSNNELTAGVERFDNAILVDWFTAADEHSDLFAGDGFHPSQAGRVVLADLIAWTILNHGEPADSQ